MGAFFRLEQSLPETAGQSAPELFRSRLWVTISIAFRGDFWGIRSKTGISLGVHHSRDVREATGAYSTRQSWTSRDRLEPWSVRVSTPLDPQTTTSGSVTALLGHTRQKSAKIPLLLVLLFEYDFWFFFLDFERALVALGRLRRFSEMGVSIFLAYNRSTLDGVTCARLAGGIRYMCACSLEVLASSSLGWLGFSDLFKLLERNTSNMGWSI